MATPALSRDDTDQPHLKHQPHPKRVLCLWLPEWPIQRLVVAAPEYRQQCVVLSRTDPRSGKRVSAASPAARQQGIRADMPLSEAKSLMTHAAASNDQRRSFILEHDRVADMEALQQLAWALERFSPVIGLEQNFTHTNNRKKQKNDPQFQPSSLLMDVTGLSHLFGGFASLANQVRTWCMDLGYVVHVAIANTTGLAWGVAHFHPDCRHDLPWVIDEIDNPNKTDVQHEIDVQHETGNRHEAELADAVMQTLSVLALRLPPDSSSTLQRLGIESIGQLLRIDRGDLRSRLGDDLLKRVDQMSGKIDEPIVACQQTPEFFAEQSLDYATSHRETIEVVVQRLVNTLCQELKTRQQGGLQWLVRLVPHPHPADPQSTPRPVELRVNLFQPTAETDQVMPMVAMQLEQALLPHLAAADWKKASRIPNRAAARQQNSGRPSSPKKHYRYTSLEFQRIVVEVVSSIRMIARQRQLFDETPGLNQESLAGLINRLSVRLGTANVVTPALRKGAQPEWSVQFKPLVDPTRVKKRIRRSPVTRTSADAALVSHVMGRPLKLISPPVNVEVQRAPPTHEHSNASGAAPFNEIAFRPPIQIGLGGQHINQTAQPIVKSWGPERIETGWWRGMTVRRDYWRIVTEKGQQFWVYCDLRTQQWFLHGEF